jgi:hypothetical protein
MNWNLCPPQPRRSDEGVPSYVYAARKMARTETQDSHFALVICLLLRAEGVFFRTPRLPWQRAGPAHSLRRSTETIENNSR